MPLLPSASARPDLPPAAPRRVAGSSAGVATRVLHRLDEPTSAERRLVRHAMRLAAAAFCVRGRDVRAPARGRAAVATARHVAIYLVHVGFGLPLMRTAGCFGRDRTTVAYACARIEDRRDDPAFDAKLNALEAALRAVADRSVSA